MYKNICMHMQYISIKCNTESSKIKKVRKLIEYNIRYKYFTTLNKNQNDI